MTATHSGLIRSMACGLLLAAISLTRPVGADTILYVDDDAPPGGDGLTWDGAHRFLSEAMNAAAAPGSDVAEIRIAGGLYRPDQSEVSPEGTGDRLATFPLPDGIPVRGGYAGWSGADPDERDIDLYETILSGDLGGDDLPGFINNDENSYHVAVTPGAGTTAILDGLIVTAGHADGDDDLFLDDGAGVFNHDANMDITDCTFQDNLADGGGGGIKNNFHGGVGELRCDGCTFVGNVAGGAAGMHNAVRAIVTDCTFTDNWATGGTYFFVPYYGEGGGLSLFGCDEPCLVSNCTFSDNEAGDEQYFGVGGGLSNDQTYSQILNCAFDRNAASIGGGGLYDSHSLDSMINACRFVNNSSNKGGGLLSADHGATIIDCTFLGNTATEFGGAIWISLQAWSEVINCLIVGNDAPFAGALGVQHTAAPTVTNCTIVNNTAEEGGAWFAVNEAVTSFVNCIVRDNGDVPITGATTPIVTYSNIEAGYKGEGNIDADAKFIQPPSPGDDGAWGTDDDVLGNLRLQGGSPCIDSGDSTALHPKIATDWGGQPRLVDDPGMRNTGYPGCASPTDRHGRA